MDVKWFPHASKKLPPKVALPVTPTGRKSPTEVNELHQKLIQAFDISVEDFDFDEELKCEAEPEFSGEIKDRGCPICGSRSGKIMEEEIKLWAHMQVTEIDLNARLEGASAPQYYGFELYQRWKDQQNS